MVKPSKKYQSFSDKFGDGEFYPELPRIDFKELLERHFVMYDAKVLHGFEGKHGKHDAAIMILAELDADEIEGEKFSTICSGTVVVERVKRALEENALPMLANPVKVDGEGNAYYNIL